MVLFIILYKLVLTLKSVDEALVYVAILMKTIEPYFHVVLFIMLYKVVLTLRLWLQPLCVTTQMKG